MENSSRRGRADRAFHQSSSSSAYNQRVAGDVDLIADFGNGTVSGMITNIRSRGPGLPYVPTSQFDSWSTNSFSIANGQIQGSDFSALLTGTDSNPNSPDVASVKAGQAMVFPS